MRSDFDLHAVESRIASSAPASPDERVLERVARRARKEPAREGWGLQRHHVWIPAGVAAALIVVAVVFGVGVRDRSNTAFARDDAVAALLPHGRVFHLVMEHESVDLSGKQPPMDITVEAWLDADEKRACEIVRDADGRLGSAWILSEGRTVNYDGVEKAVRKQIYEGPAMSTALIWWEEFRTAIDVGEAKVVGQETVGGDRYWRLHWRGGDADFSWDSTALLREGDYRPLSLDTKLVAKNPPGSGMDSREEHHVKVRVTAWEDLPRERFDKDFFTPERVWTMVPEGTKAIETTMPPTPR